MNVWIGTAGYSYPDWLGGFYPLGTSAAKMLPEYSRHFPLVELNFTFYRCPTPAMLLRLQDQAPEGFRFSIKAPKSFSHDLSDRDAESFRIAVERLGDRLAMVVCQFPNSFHHSMRHRAWLNQLAGMLDGLPIGVEFRHWSWSRPRLAEQLQELGLHLISVDVPKIPTLFPRGLHRTEQTIYVRFHSRNSENWFRGQKERHDYHFTDSQLGEWADALELQAGKCRDAYLIFNNCLNQQAIDNARRMADLLRRRTWLTVVSPFESDAPQQLSLFDA